MSYNISAEAVIPSIEGCIDMVATRQGFFRVTSSPSVAIVVLSAASISIKNSNFGATNVPSESTVRSEDSTLKSTVFAVFPPDEKVSVVAGIEFIAVIIEASWAI